MRAIRSVAAFVLTLAVVLLAAPTAQAHTELSSSDPAANATLAAAPTTITLTFEEAVTLPNDAVKVTGPDGAAWTVGTPRTEDNKVIAPVQANGPAGAYTIAWQVRSDDGDIVKGTIPFTLTAAAGAAATPSSAPSAAAAPASPAPQAAQNGDPQNASQNASSGVPAWVWVLVVVVVVAIIAGVALRGRRRT